MRTLAYLTGTRSEGSLLRRVLMLAVTLTLAAGLFAWTASAQQAEQPPKIAPKILNDLRTQGTSSFFIVMKEQANTDFAASIEDWDLRGRAVVEALQAVATRTQADLLPRVKAVDPNAVSYWAVNAIWLTTSDPQLVQELAARPDVAYLRADDVFQIPDPQPGTQEASILAVEWNITRIRAPEVWQQFGVRGENIVVANIDTGVQYNHPALVLQYRGRQADGSFNHNYNWFDPSRVCGNPSLVPCDNVFHGTHTMGTMVGDDGGPNQIGVAPRAKWIAAKGCETSGCSLSALVASGQWVLAPTDLNGQNPRPDLRPHVVNNSWGDGPADPFYRTVVQNWRNAGIFPAFANGNPGSACGAASVPGVYPESFGVGATDINDNIAGFSGRGPANAFGGVTKPNASAPGVNVRSSVPTNNYASFSGTSMATPHVAGAVALIWSARPSVKGDIPKTFDVLQSKARPRLDTQCGPAGPPNNVYGWGIIEVFAAIQSITPIRAEPDQIEVCRPTAGTTNIRVFGGPGLFTNDVTLSLMSVAPAPPAGGEITADFNPNPVLRPPAAGATSAMTVSSTNTTPPNTYTLTVRGSDGVRSETTPVTLVLRSQAADSPALLTPADLSDGVVETPTFTWSPAAQATTYRVQVFAGEGCTGNLVRDFDNITGTSFTVPAAQGLPFFQTFSWTATSRNSCGPSVPAQCFSFRTRSCAITPQEVAINGGFEQELTGWIVDATVPPPVVTTERFRSGTKSLKLGNILPNGTPTAAGDSEVHQTFTLPASAVNAKLTFWFWPQSFDSVDFDQQEAFVVPINPRGPAVSLMREANNAQAWLRREYSLDAFRGTTFEIHFRVHDDAAPDPTGMYVDDVSVSFVSCGPPDFFLTATAPTQNEVCAGNSIPFTVGVRSLNGPNFTSPVLLNATNLPPGTTADFVDNPVLVEGNTTMTLNTVRPTIGGRYFFSLTGDAVTPPPADTRSAVVDTFISANPPTSPERISPAPAQVNVPRRPTLSWTAPFVPDSQAVAAAAANPADMLGNTPGGLAVLANPSDSPIHINVFGAARYRVQLALDRDFINLVANTETPETTFTVPADLATATQYYWRVNAANACGTSPFSASGSFVTGACFEGWATNPPVPIIGGGPSQPSVVAFGGKIYVIGGGVGPGPNTRINQVWEFDPATNAWTRKADIPSPGPGSTYGSAAEVGGKIYVFGGVSGPPGPIVILRTLWIYNVAANTWTRGRDLPGDNFGIAVAAVGSKIILATGSGFGRQTWQYDPATDSYTRLADAPAVPAPVRMHAAAIGNEVHAFAGGFNGNAHIVYNAANDTWRTAPPMPFGVTDPAVAVIAGKFYVAGGRPTARLQIFDPTTNTWTQGPPITGLPGGLDNTAGAAIGFKLYVAGGFDGTNGSNAHRVFTVCGSNSAQNIPYVVDGDGTVPGISNESSSLVLSNDLAGSTVEAKLFFYAADGTLDSSSTISLAPRETKVLNNVIRTMRGASTVQNVKGSLTILATQTLDAMSSLTHGESGDVAVADAQPLAGLANGFLPLIQLNSASRTQVVLTNASGTAAIVELLAYPAGGGVLPAASAVVIVPPHAISDFPDIVSRLGLPAGYSGQLTWSSSQPLYVFSRRVVTDARYSGAAPARSPADGSNSLLVPYVEDSDLYSYRLEINNPGSTTANVTVSYVDVADTTGATPGVSSSRDIVVPVNSATTIPDVVRWALRSDGGVPLNQQGFLVISSSQPITAQATLVNNLNSSPETISSAQAAKNSFLPISISGTSFVAISNPGTLNASLALMAFNANGTPAIGAPMRITVVGGGLYLTGDILSLLGLTPDFTGSVSITSDAAVVVTNLITTGDNGGVAVPVRPR